jgi:hypothetical protein
MQFGVISSISLPQMEWQSERLTGWFLCFEISQIYREYTPQRDEAEPSSLNIKNQKINAILCYY